MRLNAAFALDRKRSAPRQVLLAAPGLQRHLLHHPLGAVFPGRTRTASRSPNDRHRGTAAPAAWSQRRPPNSSTRRSFSASTIAADDRRIVVFPGLRAGRVEIPDGADMVVGFDHRGECLQRRERRHRKSPVTGLEIGSILTIRTKVMAGPRWWQRNPDLNTGRRPCERRDDEPLSNPRRSALVAVEFEDGRAFPAR